MHTHIHTSIGTCIHTYTHIYIYIYTHTRTHIHTFIHKEDSILGPALVSLSLSFHLYVERYKSIYIYAHIQLCIYIQCVYIYTHICIHIYIYKEREAGKGLNHLFRDSCGASAKGPVRLVFPGLGLRPVCGAKATSAQSLGLGFRV